MNKYKKLAAFLSAIGVFCLSTAARADIPSPGAAFHDAHPQESMTYGVIAMIALASFAVGLSLLLLSKLRRKNTAKQGTAEKIIAKK